MRGSSCSYVDHAATALDAKLNLALDQREQGVVATATDSVARMEVSATLTQDDLARVDLLSTEALHAETLCV
jgi:hypothetical protein